MEFNSDEFWTLPFTPDESQISVYRSRKRLEQSSPLYLGKVGGTTVGGTMSSIMTKKRLSALDTVKVESNIVVSDIANVEGNDLSTDEQEMAEQIKDELIEQGKQKALETYYNLYMGSMNSDAEYRLGKVVSTVLDAGEVDGNDIIHSEDGRTGLYTRSDFSKVLQIPYYYFGKKEILRERFSSFGFPPFKLSESISDKTEFDVEGKDFDLNNFILYKEGLTYRDVGFKQLNDNITYMQWLLEGVTGIVSTYLTEWDLSVYMQEGFLSKNANDSILKMYLNYRIYNDNPFADKNFKYKNANALCFNVAGSAVSVLESDNRKTFRPSDYPYSKWWIPYLKDIDYTVKTFNIEYGDATLSIPYMSIYDEVSWQFNYEGESVKSICVQQDFINMILSCKKSPSLKFYEAFYTTPDDGLSAFDITVKNYMKKISGADCGKATEAGKDISALMTEARIEMLVDGGIFGTTPVGNTSSSFYNNDELRSEIVGVAKGENADDDVMTFDEPVIKNIKSKANSTQAKMTGINRFSPILYGGPHGRDISPKSIQFFFDSNSILNQNVPAIDVTNQHKNFTSTFERDYFCGKESRYLGKNLNNMSPSFAIKTLLHGRYKGTKKSAVLEVNEWFEQEGTYILDENSKWVPVFHEEDVVEVRGDVYEKEKLFRIYKTEYETQNPATWEQYGWVNVYNPNALTTTEVVDGVETQLVKLRVPFREVKSKRRMLTDFEYVNTTASIDAAWTITLKKVTNIYKKSVAEYISNLKYKHLKESELLSLWEENSPQYVLEFDDKKLQDKFIENVILANGSAYSEPEVFFFESRSLTARFDEGPNSIFSSKVSLKYVFNMKSYEFDPILVVDLSKCAFFETDLRSSVFDNRQSGESGTFLHLCEFQGSSVSYTSPQELLMVDDNGELSMKGFGYTTYFPGLSPTAAKYTNEFGITYDSMNAIKREGSIYDRLCDLNLNLVEIKQFASYEKKDGQYYIHTSELEPRRKKIYADKGLTEAFLKICTRAKFYKTSNGQAYPVYISIASPLRNYVSCAQASIPYLKELKENFKSTLSFNTIRDALRTCVDKCVLKANGMNPDFTICEADKAHPLYNYWIDYAIRIFEKGEITESKFIDSLDTQISLVESSIAAIEKTLSKPIIECTTKELIDAFSMISAMYEATKDETVSKVFISYLHILYQYRMYFIGKRFNKEDGTMFQMRALEKVLDFVAPSETVEEPDLSEPQEEDEKYSVTFFEIQNRLNDKLRTYVDDDEIPLDVDCLSKLYVKVQWTDEKAYNDYIAFKNGEGPKVREVVKIKHGDVEKYAYKPMDGVYQLFSAEYNANLKNLYENKLHPHNVPLPVEDSDPIILDITWQNSDNMTPIKFDVFGSVNAEGLLEYSKMSVSPSDLICLIEEGSDFWTIKIPGSIKAHHSLFKSCVTLKKKQSNKAVQISNKRTVVAGPFAYNLSPILKEEGFPSPSLSGFDFSKFIQS